MVTATQLLPVLKQVESAGDPNALSPKGAAGAFQIMPATAAAPGYGVTPLQGWDGKDPRTAHPAEQERFARDYLQAMSALHGGDVKLALASYNAGPGAVQMAGNTVPNYPETQNYVNKITSQGADVAATNVSPDNTATDWRTRAQPVTEAAPVTPDWRANAQPVVAAGTPGDWRARAQPAEVAGNDMGAGAAAVQGFNSAVPFGERVAAGLGAVGAKAYDMTLGDGVTEGQSVGDLYRQGRQDQEKTATQHSGAYTAGALTGVAATLPMLSTKVLTGERTVTGARGAVNAIPEALGAVGNYVRGGKVAADAETLAKVANVAGKASRAATVSAPTGALYAYGGSRSDLDSQGAFDDAKTGAAVSAALGAAVPVAGAALKSISKPNVSQAVKDLAATAKSKFGIDLSLDQIAPSNVRDTVQKISQTIPGSGVDAFHAKQAGQWMRGVAKTIGQDADNLGPETITKFLDDASSKFEGIVQHTDMKYDTKSLDALQEIANKARSNITKDYADLVVGKAENLANQLFTQRNLAKSTEFATKTLNGKKLASIRSQLIKELPNVAGDARHYVSEMVDVIDNIAEKNLAKADIEKLGVARREWRNYKTIEPLLEKSTDGTINPTQLMQRVATSKYIKASRKAVGEDDLVDLARIGKQFMVKKGGSDTAQKVAYMKGAADLGTTAGLIAAPFKVAPALIANRGYQKMVNQSPKVVSRLVNNTEGKSNAIPIANMLGAQAAPGPLKITIHPEKK